MHLVLEDSIDSLHQPRDELLLELARVRRRRCSNHQLRAIVIDRRHGLDRGLIVAIGLDQSGEYGAFRLKVLSAHRRRIELLTGQGQLLYDSHFAFGAEFTLTTGLVAPFRGDYNRNGLTFMLIRC